MEYNKDQNAVEEGKGGKDFTTNFQQLNLEKKGIHFRIDF